MDETTKECVKSEAKTDATLPDLRNTSAVLRHRITQADRLLICGALHAAARWEETLAESWVPCRGENGEHSQEEKSARELAQKYLSLRDRMYR